MQPRLSMRSNTDSFPPVASEPARPITGSTRRLARVLVILLGIAALVGLWIYESGTERRAIRELPPDEQLALYQRTRANVQSACEHPPADLSDFCRQQAEFLLHFPQCDQACEQLARERLSVLGSPR